MKLSFEATREDGSPRKFSGMHRPPFEQYISVGHGGYMKCSCGEVLQTQGHLREHWQMGHLDRAVYEEGE